MIHVTNIEVFNFSGALRGMRNPMKSHEKSDSCFCDEFDACSACDYYNYDDCVGCEGYASNPFVIGKEDMKLCRKLIKAGSEHRKFLRQIFVSMDITAPTYWWLEFDTYKVGTASNSESKMHTLAKRDLTLDDFAYEGLTGNAFDQLEDVIEEINASRKHYIDYEGYVLSREEKHLPCTYTKQDFWLNMLKLLPMCFKQKRTVTMNYENVLNILAQRRHHKLSEWRRFCSIMTEDLPYLLEFTEGLLDNDGVTDRSAMP